MSLLDTVSPLNLREEKERFFADETYNPQFQYSEPIPAEVLHKYGVPISPYVELAQEVLNRAYFNQTESDLLRTEGPIVSQKDVVAQTERFLKIHHLEKRYDITWSSTFVSRASITTTHIKFRTGAEFRTENLNSLLYHEIGTHALRRINYEQQPWFKKKKQYGFAEYLFTEEGLASLHSLLPKSNTLAYTFAIRYLAVQYAQAHSFVELWNYLSAYIDNHETRWMVACRQKRGVIDTSQPGGFTKDLTYFQGMVEVWNWLQANNFDITPLYFGKMALVDTVKAQSLNPHFMPLLPVFFRDYHEQYAESIHAIGVQNMVNQLANN